jgi:hypothetical protein
MSHTSMPIYVKLPTVSKKLHTTSATIPGVIVGGSLLLTLRYYVTVTPSVGLANLLSIGASVILVLGLVGIISLSSDASLIGIHIWP